MSCVDTGPATARVHDRYLSDRALLEAAAALRGLSATLLSARTVFADDAAVDAARLASLADDLTAWSHAAPSGADAQHWLGLLRVYLRPALRPPR